MPNKNLLKCPFCGAYAKLRRKNRTTIGGETFRNTFVYCPTCDGRGSRVLYRDFEDAESAENHAIELWNRRK